MGWCPPVLGMEPAVPWDGRPREVPGLCEDHGPGIPATPLVGAPVTTPPYHAHQAGIPVVRAVSWDGARQFVGWSPCGWCPLVASGTATRPPRRAHSQHGVKAPPGADPWPPQPPQSCCTFGNDTLKNHPATRGGGKLNGQSNVLPRVFAKSDVSDTPQRLWLGARWTVAAQGAKGKCLTYVVQQGGRHRHQPPSGRTPSIPGGIRGSSKVQGVLGRVLEESPYP